MPNIKKKSSPLRRSYLIKLCEKTGCTIGEILSDPENNLSKNLRTEALLMYFEMHGKCFLGEYNQQEKKHEP